MGTASYRELHTDASWQWTLVQAAAAIRRVQGAGVTHLWCCLHPLRRHVARHLRRRLFRHVHHITLHTAKEFKGWSQH